MHCTFRSCNRPGGRLWAHVSALAGAQLGAPNALHRPGDPRRPPRTGVPHPPHKPDATLAPGTNRTRISPPPGTKRTRISPLRGAVKPPAWRRAQASWAQVVQELLLPVPPPPPPPSPSPCTNWTRLVLPPVLGGHVSSFPPPPPPRTPTAPLAVPLTPKIRLTRAAACVPSSGAPETIFRRRCSRMSARPRSRRRPTRRSSRGSEARAVRPPCAPLAPPLRPPCAPLAPPLCPPCAPLAPPLRPCHRHPRQGRRRRRC